MIRPLEGQVLIEVLPPNTKTSGGIDLPDNPSIPPEIVQEQAMNPVKPTGQNIGIVRAIGSWPKLKCGLRLLPEYGIGAKVVFNPYRGTQLQRGLGDRLKLVSQSDVLAILKESV